MAVLRSTYGRGDITITFNDSVIGKMSDTEFTMFLGNELKQVRTYLEAHRFSNRAQGAESLGDILRKTAKDAGISVTELAAVGINYTDFEVTPTIVEEK